MKQSFSEALRNELTGSHPGEKCAFLKRMNRTVLSKEVQI